MCLDDGGNLLWMRMMRNVERIITQIMLIGLPPSRMKLSMGGKH
jgi:hypothetical protein